MRKLTLNKQLNYFFVVGIIFFLVSQTFPQNRNMKYPIKQVGKVKNIIIFIGDGMGSPQLTVASYFKNKTHGSLEIEKMPVVGLVKTHAENDWITDSASGATALATGHKTNVGMVGVTSDSLAKETIFEAGKKKGMKTGIVVTSHITDATPACFVAHVPQRGMRNEIAAQIIHSQLDVILGGGYEYFIPQTVKNSVREDDRNLIQEAKKLGYQFVKDTTSFAAIKSGSILGLFNNGGLTTNPPEPSISDMTRKAIHLLNNSDSGFLLMVEGSQIDWRGHANDLEGIIKQTLLFDEAVKVGLEFAKEDKETLVLVTADHETGGITLTGDDRDTPFSFRVKWGTGGHTAIPVPIYAFGPHAIEFTGVLDNTDIPKIISRLMNFDLHKVLSLKNAHSHNDYKQAYPLYNALNNGFKSIEADIFLVDGELYVAHDFDEIKRANTLKNLYLEPLKQILICDNNQYSSLFPLKLIIDIKSDALSTYKVLNEQLKQYKEFITTYENGKVSSNKIDILISGNRPIEYMSNQKERLAAIDGRLEDINKPNILYPLISESIAKILDDTRDIDLIKIILTKLSENIHVQNKKIRLWGCPDNKSSWEIQSESNIDFIGTDNPSKLKEYLVKRLEN